jgi:hypothetical protein
MSVISGQKTVTAHGTAVQLASLRQVNSSVMIKALDGNTGLVYVGQVTGDVDSSNGMELSAGEVVVFSFVGNLAEIWVDSAVDNEGVCWLLLDV